MHGCKGLDGTCPTKLSEAIMDKLIHGFTQITNYRYYSMKGGLMGKQ